MNSHWLRAEREMSQIGRCSLNFKLAIGEMNFSSDIHCTYANTLLIGHGNSGYFSQK